MQLQVSKPAARGSVLLGAALQIISPGLHGGKRMNADRASSTRSSAPAAHPPHNPAAPGSVRQLTVMVPLPGSTFSAPPSA